MRVEGVDYLVERSLILEHDGLRWTEHRLSSDACGRSLWLEVPENQAPLVVHERAAQLAPVADLRLLEGAAPSTGVLLAAGKATYRTIERAGAGKRGDLFYVGYGRGHRRVTFERHREDEPWQVWHGRLIDSSSVRLA